MFVIGGGEQMLVVVSIIDKVMIIGIIGIQGCVQRVSTGVADRSGRDTTVLAGIVGAVNIQMLPGQLLNLHKIVAQCIVNGRIRPQGQNVLAGQPIIKYGSNIIALTPGGGFLLNDGSQSDHILHGQGVFFDISIGIAFVLQTVSITPSSTTNTYSVTIDGETVALPIYRINGMDFAYMTDEITITVTHTDADGVVDTVTGTYSLGAYITEMDSIDVTKALYTFSLAARDYRLITRDEVTTE